MKKALIIIPNILIIGVILFFIVRYANDVASESRQSAVASFEKMTMTTNQIIANYLEDEQHLCDIWSNYINSSAKSGKPMTTQEAIDFLRKATTSPEIEAHLIFLDDPDRAGLSTDAEISDPNDYRVSYRNINIFDNMESVNNANDIVNLTRAYTNPMNGVQSIAFLNPVTVFDEEQGKVREGILMRVVPLNSLEQKLVFLKGEYENVELSLVDKEGNYVVHGKSFKNSNFFEYYKSYNAATAGEYEQLIEEITTGTGTMVIKNAKGEDCIISYTPLAAMNRWFLLAYIPADELVANRSVDWMLLGIVSLGLFALLIFNLVILVKYNRKLSEAAQLANQANDAKSYFLSTMSHDIRTPMNAILGLNEMVLRESGDDNIRMYSENIRTAGTTLLSLINDILDFSKIEAGKMEIINVDYSFVSLLNDLVNMVQKRAEDKCLSFHLDIDQSIPMVMNGDEIRIKQVITNILSNAVKYTKQGSITFSVKAKKQEDKPDTVCLRVSVADTGIGIKPEELDRLFVAFERIEEKKNRNIEGTGLGMTIAQSFLAMMESHLEVESEYGKGSVFSFEIDQKVVKWDPIGDYEEAFRRTLDERVNYREKFTAPHARVLVVDDTPVNLTVFINLLKQTEIQIDTAESGDECMPLFTNKHYDVIFLDHMMPDKDGIEVLREMKQMKGTPNDDTPVICLTANAISGMREMYTNAGFDDYLTKPIDAERLEEMLMRYLPKGKLAPPSDAAADDYVIPDFLFHIREIDVNSGLNHCGSRESYIQTLGMYLDTAEKNAEDIENYWAVRDIKNTTIKIHALKSTSRVVGALKLGEFAARLEKAGHDEDIETIEKEIGSLITRYRQLAAELSPLNEKAPSEDEDERPFIEEKELREFYSELAEYCENYDFDSVVDLVESIEKYRIPEDEATRVDAIRKAVDNYDYELIPGILSGEMG